MLEQFAPIEVSIADYESLALGSKNESVRLGALNKRAEQQRQHFELRREYGIVPAPDEMWSATEFIQLALELLAKADLAPRIGPGSRQLARTCRHTRTTGRCEQLDRRRLEPAR